MRYHSLRRRGQALVEFAVVAFVVTLLLTGMVTLGMMLFGAQVLQQAADVGAQELSRLPLPPTQTWEQLLHPDDPNDPAARSFREQIYDETKLVLPADYSSGSELPLINRLLLPLYIVDTDSNVRRYPGTLLKRASDEALIVMVPLATVDEFGNTAIEEWVPVVRVNETQFPLGADSNSGMVSLTITYPYQSAALVAYRYEDNVGNVPVAADEVSATLPDGYTLVADDETIGAHAGSLGLGRMYSQRLTVRPYRKVISAQGIYRREVFGLLEASP